MKHTTKYMSRDILDLQSSFAKLLPLNKEYDRVADIFEKSYGSDAVCISAIFKITNPNLIDQFERQRQIIKEKRGKEPQIVEVFHGTTQTAAKSIIVSGFDPSYSVMAAYGKGTYASPHIKTALSYCKDATKVGNTSMIFLGRFLKGTFGSYSAGGLIDTKYFDYSGNDGNILVTPYAGGIIPDYLICYYSWDKRTSAKEMKIR